MSANDPFATSNMDTFSPVLNVADLENRISTLSAEEAALLVQQVQAATEEKKSAKEIISAVASAVGTGLKLFL